MGADRRCDCDGVHSAAFNQLLSIVKREQSGVELVRLGQVIRPLVGYRCDRKSWVFLKAAKQVWTPVAKTDNSQSYRHESPDSSGASELYSRAPVRAVTLSS